MKKAITRFIIKILCFLFIVALHHNNVFAQNIQVSAKFDSTNNILIGD